MALGPRITSIRRAEEGGVAVAWSAPLLMTSPTRWPSSSMRILSPPRPRMTGWEVPGPMLVTATPGTDSTVCARVAASRRCRFSPAKTAEGRIVSFAAVGFTTAVTTTSGKGMAATSRSTVTISPGRASTATAAYPSRSIRSRRRSASGTAMRNDPSPCVTALPPVLTTVAIAPARGIPPSADRTIPATWSRVSAACRPTGEKPAEGAGTPARIIPRRKTGTEKRLDIVMAMPDGDMVVSCWVHRQRRTLDKPSADPRVGLGGLLATERRRWGERGSGGERSGALRGPARVP